MVQLLPEVATATPADTVAKCDDDDDASEDNDDDAIGDDADDNENNNDDGHKADNEDAPAQSPPHSIPPAPQILQLPNHDFRKPSLGGYHHYHLNIAPILCPSHQKHQLEVERDVF